MVCSLKITTNVPQLKEECMYVLSMLNGQESVLVLWGGVLFWLVYFFPFSLTWYSQRKAILQEEKLNFPVWFQKDSWLLLAFHVCEMCVTCANKQFQVLILMPYVLHQDMLKEVIFSHRFMKN